MSQADGNKAALTLYMPELTCDKGSFMVAIYSEDKKFLSDDATLKRRIPCAEFAGNRITLPLNTGNAYAVAIYHDRNDNQKLDKNIFQYPSETFGFSNNPGILTGPPSFADAKFSFEQEMEITIRLK